jgi:hypothetical protein
MQKIRYIKSLVLFVIFILLLPVSIAQAINPPPSNEQLIIKPLNIPYIEGEVIIDGEINDDLWLGALSIELDLVNSPWDNLPSPVKTAAKLVENGEFLYISFVASDPEPENIQAFLTDRDNAWFHDLVGIKLDTHNNRRLNYEFFVNPYGVQNDSTFNEITGEANDSWDGLWYAFGKKTAQGYQVEIAIPYNILNFKSDGQEKKWAIELVRIYPRDTSLRISHVPINRDNPCWLCQYPEAIGFETAKIDKNIRLTPTLAATSDAYRDVNSLNSDISEWTTENEIAAGLDLRWGINANNLLNATINPDFSTVESDSGQLNVNTNFSLFYEEKRAFFLDNSDYFSSDFNLVYTRNIADPDYGAKLTGRIDKHSYGVFSTNDTETNILLPGNLGSQLVTLNKESHSGALRYRYDFSDDLTVGTITTFRSAESYHNYVFGVDARYRLSESNAIKAQILNSDTLYDDGVFSNISTLQPEFNENNFSDKAFKVNFNHNSEYWLLDLEHQNIGADFRADLGYIPKTDIKTNQVLIKRNFYSEHGSYWQEAGISGQWKIAHNLNNELIERELTTNFTIDGPLQSVFEIALIHGERVGLRYDNNSTAIDGNTTFFNEDQLTLFTSAYLNNRTYISLDFTVGDKIDYSNDRLGNLIEVTGNINVFLTDHLEFDFYQTYSKLDAKEDNVEQNVYTANISELRVSYQFDVRSYLKLSLVYDNIEYPNTNSDLDSEQIKALSTQLIYSYKLNPQTVFFLGYSDNSYQENDLTKLTQTERTFFTKISYAWAH